MVEGRGGLFLEEGGGNFRARIFFCPPEGLGGGAKIATGGANPFTLIHGGNPSLSGQNYAQDFGPFYSFSRGRGRIPRGVATPKFMGGGLPFCPPY